MKFEKRITKAVDEWMSRPNFWNASSYSFWDDVCSRELDPMLDERMVSYCICNKLFNMHLMYDDMRNRLNEPRT